MSSSRPSEPLSPECVIPPRPASGRVPALPPAVCVVWMTLPAQGDELNGRALCERIRQFVRAHHSGTFCFVLDGTAMETARIGFANAFKELDRELGGRLEMVCAIPAPIPRMMVYTVATLALAPWSILRTRGEVELHLRLRGYLAEDGAPRREGPSHLWLQNPA